jgi:hypothetical protein
MALKTSSESTASNSSHLSRHEFLRRVTERWQRPMASQIKTDDQEDGKATRHKLHNLNNITRGKNSFTVLSVLRMQGLQWADEHFSR